VAFDSWFRRFHSLVEPGRKPGIDVGTIVARNPVTLHGSTQFSDRGGVSDKREQARMFAGVIGDVGLCDGLERLSGEAEGLSGIPFDERAFRRSEDTALQRQRQ